ncbi:MAG: hypothetical protein RQ936_06810 [Gammaproteobacteria bacterium]|nr:hypothetical protein [Gammaproteobacteria bacterium]
MTVTQKILQLLLLKAVPQDLPCSSRLLLRIIFLYVGSGIVVMGSVAEPALALGRVVLSLAVISVFSYVLLSALNMKARYLQTVTALIGTGIIFNLMAWPVLSFGDIEQASAVAVQLLSLAVIALISWEVLVTAHIFRNALDTKMTQAVLLSMALFLVTLTLSQLVFPETSS